MNIDRKKYLRVQYFVFLVYFILTTIIFIILPKFGNGVSLQITGGGDDGALYWEQAQNVAAGKDWIKTSIYPFIIGNLIKFTGLNSSYIIRLFNYFGFILLVFFSMALIEIQFRYKNEEIEDKYIYKAKTLLLLSFLFYISLLSINLSILRDIWIYMLYILCVLLSIEVIFFKKKKVINIALLVFSLLLLGGFRKYALLSFILAIGIYYFNKMVVPFIKFKRVILIILLLFGIYYTFFMDFTIFNMSLGRALDYRATFLDLEPGGSQMWIRLEKSNFFLFLANYIHSYIGNFIGPLPWHISGWVTLFIFFVETIPMLFILIFLWKEKDLLTELQKYILLQGFVWIALIGATNDNIGAATRLRPVAWILVLIVFVVEYSKYKYSKEAEMIGQVQINDIYDGRELEDIKIDNQDLISVIMSAYNEDLKWIRESVESVLNQTYKNLELIIVLDNPENIELKNLLESYVEKDNRITLLINEENVGVVKSSNRAIKACKGKYVARMDADDISEIHRLVAQKECLEWNDIDFVFSGVKVIDENSIVKYESHDRVMNHEKLKKLFKIVNISYHPTWFMKKDVFDNLGGYREIPHTEDYDFILRALDKGYKLGRMNRNIARYRIRETSISINNSLEQFLYMRKLTKIYNKGQIEDYNVVAKSLNNVKESITINDKKDYKRANTSYEAGAILWKNKDKIKALFKFARSVFESRYMLLKYAGLLRYKLADKLY